MLVVMLFTAASGVVYLSGNFEPINVVISHLILLYVILVGTAVAQWLRCCAANRKVAVSIPAGVTGIYH